MAEFQVGKLRGKPMDQHPPNTKLNLCCTPFSRLVCALCHYRAVLLVPNTAALPARVQIPTANIEGGTRPTRIQQPRFPMEIECATYGTPPPCTSCRLKLESLCTMALSSAYWVTLMTLTLATFARTQRWDLSAQDTTTNCARVKFESVSRRAAGLRLKWYFPSDLMRVISRALYRYKTGHCKSVPKFYQIYLFHF